MELKVITLCVKALWDCTTPSNMLVGIQSESQESPLHERRNYIFVTFVSLSTVAQGSFDGAMGLVGFHSSDVGSIRKSFHFTC